MNKLKNLFKNDNIQNYELWACETLYETGVYFKAKARWILMDIKMPEMNGNEATRVVKQMKPQLPLITQTAYTMASDRGNALVAGCDDYISKPVKKEKLHSIIQEYLV